jgi:hypothetical protein
MPSPDRTPSLFPPVEDGPYRATAVPRQDRTRVPDEAQPRLSRQCREILDALRGGRKPNSSLIAIAQRFGARIFDLNKWFQATGQPLDIRIVEQNRATGYCVYALFKDGMEVRP